LPFAALPPDIPPSLQQDNPELPPQGQAMADEEEEMIQDVLLNQDESEHLPGSPNKSSGSSESEDESLSSDDSNDDIQAEEGRVGQEGCNAAVVSSQNSRRNSNDDPNGMMPGQLSLEAPALDYQGKKDAAIAHIKTLTGKSFPVKHKSRTMTWTVIEEWIPSDSSSENKPLPGLFKFDHTQYTREQVLANLFLHLMFSDWHINFQKLNSHIIKDNQKQGKKVRQFTEEKSLTAFGLFISAAEYGQRGACPWREGDQRDSDEEWESMVPHPSFQRFMKLYHFQEFRHYLPLVCASETLQRTNDPWWQFREAVKKFNQNRAEKLCFPDWAAIDESTSAWKP
jgi:hypothetical protein